MEAVYFTKWVSSQGRGIGLLVPEDAERRHNDGEPYVALLREGGVNRYLVNFAPPWISIDFFDELGRAYMRYDFHREPDLGLFLKGALHRTFDSNPESIASSHQFNFERDGIYIAARRSDMEIVEVTGSADASVLFAEYPSFGAYDHLCSVERGIRNDA